MADPVLAATEPGTGGAGFTMWDFYVNYWRPFGELLTDMEQRGMLVDTRHLAAMEAVAQKYQGEMEDTFRAWAAERVPNAAYMNIGSGPQIRQLLFAGDSTGAIYQWDIGRKELIQSWRGHEGVFDVAPPGPFRAMPRGLLQTTGNAVMRVATDQVLRGFLRTLIRDYDAWGSDAAYRDRRARDVGDG